jgi:hypothetical protein
MPVGGVGQYERGDSLTMMTAALIPARQSGWILHGAFCDLTADTTRSRAFGRASDPVYGPTVCNLFFIFEPEACALCQFTARSVLLCDQAGTHGSSDHATGLIQYP